MPLVRFTLAPALCSWGEGGLAERPTADTPSWSAIVGLLGAALGLPRNDPGLLALSREYAMGVKVVRPGIPMYDYHTIETPAVAKRVAVARGKTRFDELDTSLVGESTTTLTHRQYLQDARYELFIVPLLVNPTYTPDALQAALCNPVYPLSAGRRSCLIGRVNATLDSLMVLAECTHWDSRLTLDKPVALTRVRQDFLIAPRRFGRRLERLAA